VPGRLSQRLWGELVNRDVRLPGGRSWSPGADVDVDVDVGVGVGVGAWPPARCRDGPVGGQGGLTSHTCSTLYTFMLLTVLIYQHKTGSQMVVECAKWSWSVQSGRGVCKVGKSFSIMVAIRGRPRPEQARGTDVATGAGGARARPQRRGCRCGTVARQPPGRRILHHNDRPARERMAPQTVINYTPTGIKRAYRASCGGRFGLG
jgi:hypothetical protein